MEEGKSKEARFAVSQVVCKSKEEGKAASLLEKFLGVKYWSSASLHSAMKSKLAQLLLMLQRKCTRHEAISERKGEGTSCLATTTSARAIRILLEARNANDINDRAEVEEVEEEGVTPLYIDVRQSRVDVIKQFFENIAKRSAWCAVARSCPRDSNDSIFSVGPPSHRNYEANWRREQRRDKFKNGKSPTGIFTPLHLAIKSNGLRADRLLAIICLLVECGANLELKDKFGRTPLQLAVELRKLDVAEFLLIAGANINCRTSSCSTPLLAALENADIAAIRHLLKRGAKAELKNRRGESSLHVAIRAIEERKVRYEVVQLLLASRVKINDSDCERSSALHLALLREDFSLFYLLVSRGSFINRKNAQGHSPLYIAVARNLLEEVKILLKLGANVNDLDNNKVSVLAGAVEQANEEMIRLLLRHNANVRDNNSVMLAADHGSVNIMKMLIDKGADVNAVDKEGLSVLVHAILFKQIAMVQCLLDNGADINSENKNCMPLTYSFLLYNFNGFVVPNSSEMETYKLIMDLVLSRIALRDSQDLDVHEENLKLIEAKDIMRAKYEDYCRELVIMKGIKVGEDSCLTYYDLFIKRQGALVQCLRCAKLRDKLLSGDYRSLFVGYSEQMERHYEKGLKRWLLMNRLEGSLNEIFGSLLPLNVTNKICEYFSDNEVEKFLQHYEAPL